MMLSTAPVSLIHRLVPVDDLAAFHRLSERNQVRVNRLLAAFDLVDRAPSKMLGYEQAATLLGGMRGMSAKSIRRLYASFSRSRDWRSLVDYAVEGKPGQRLALPADFLAEIQTRVDANGRSVQGALKSVRADWLLGKPIPGYGTWKDWWRLNMPHRPLPALAPDCPAGWSVRNLRRKLDGSKFRRAAQTQGLTAAKDHRPRMKHTRVGVPVGSIIMWDDLEHDFFVNDFANRQAARPLELFAHDYASAYRCFFGIRTKIKDDDGFVKKLSGDMMRLVIAGHFWRNGYHPDGTLNVAEHGTACFADDVARALHDETGGLVRLSESGFDGRAPHAGLYHGRRRGQPGHKASLESSNNLVHNRTAMLPGQTGPSKERRPEELHGRLTHNAALLQAWEWLPAEYKDHLQFPVVELGQFHRLLLEIYHQIACERDHDLEGWQACGHITQVYDVLGVMLTESDIRALPPERAARALQCVQAGLVDARPVCKSRWEVWQAGRQHLRPVAGGTVCKILGERFAQERKVRSHQFRIESEWAGSEPLYFWDHVTTPEGRRLDLVDGETYETFLNPFEPGQLFIRNARGAYLGVAGLQPVAMRGDTAAESRVAAEYAKQEAHLLGKLIGRNADQIRGKGRAHKKNATTIKEVQDRRDAFHLRSIAALDAALPEEESPRQPHSHDHETTLNDW